MDFNSQINVSSNDQIQIMRSMFDSLEPSIKKFYLFNNDTGELIDLRTQKTISSFKLSNYNAWEEFWKQQQLKTLEFFRSVRQGNLQDVIVLFSKYIIDVNAKDARAWTCLHYACSLGHDKIVTHLLEIGANPDEQDLDGVTPFILAIKGQYVNIIATLIKCVNINKADFYSNYPLQIAQNAGNQKILSLLLKAGANQENCSLKNISTIDVFEEPNDQLTPQKPRISTSGKSQFSSTTRLSKQMTYMGSNIETSEFETRLGRASTVRLNREITTDSFTFHKKLGKGAFGVVYLVTDHKTNEKMALKVLEKQQLTDKMIQYMLSEKQVMMQINHPFIVKLRYAFQNEKQLFLAMNYFQGGDLGAVLGLQVLQESDVKIYAAEIALALGELHRRNFIYRDLKPQNILIHQDGHCAITDFGLTKSIDENTKSFCGTPAYMAPEIVSHKSYNQSVDWYQLGAVVYEMLYGEPPYFSQDREELYENIKSETLTFFSSIDVSEAAKSFIKQLLHRNPEKRLGAKKDLGEIMQHPWLKDIDWQKLVNKEISVPKPYFNTNSENIIYPNFESDDKSSKKLVDNWTVLGQ